jgi:uncharacterized protein YfaS (alpha-2-macroglobulin family)
MKRVIKFVLLLALVGAVGCAPGEPDVTITSEDPQTWAPDEPAQEVPRPVQPVVEMPIGDVVVGPGRKLPVRLTDTEWARLRVVPLELGEVDQAHSALGYFETGADPFAMVEVLRNKSKAIQTSYIHGGTTSSEPSRQRAPQRREIDPFAQTKSSIVFAVLDAPGANPRAAILQRGELSTVLKVGRSGGIVWVTDTKSGQPVPNAAVAITQGRSLRFRGTTDSSGLLRLPGEARLRIQHPAKGAHDHERPLIAGVTSKQRVAFTSEYWQTGLESWNFGLPEVYGQDSLRGLVTAERGIYRPGETVHLFGSLRKRLMSGRLAPPGGAVEVELRDPDGQQVFKKKTALSRFGTFRAEHELKSTSRLGRYSLLVRHGDQSLNSEFQVGEARPVHFEIELPKTGPIQVTEGVATFPISAHYLHGAPLAGGTVSLRVSTRVSEPAGRGFVYTTRDAYGYWEEQTTLEGTLDQQGNARLTLPESELRTLGDDPQLIEVALEATVQDRGGESVSGRSVLTRATSDTLVSVKKNDWVVDPKRGWTVQVRAEDRALEPQPGKRLVVELFKRTWSAIGQKTSTGTRYQGQWQLVPVTSRTVTSGKAPVDVHFPLRDGGDYRVRVHVEGSDRYVEESIWAYGYGGAGGWDNNPRVTLRTDQASYEPGDRARVFVESPYAKATALVTVERDGVMEAHVEQLSPDGVVVPILDRYLPNVYASVALVPQLGAGTTPAAGSPLKVGYATLAVSPERRRLKVSIAPQRPEQKPGEAAELLVKVRDQQNRPVSAEVTLWAADEGVLKLTGYQTPDPFAPAYTRHPHRVRTSSSLLRWMERDPMSWDDGSGGDSDPGDGPTTAFRSRFLSTAFFSKPVVTDAHGQATVKVKMPDNLTRWRVMAAVADAGERFGSSEASITTSKPLSIEPALPRFLTVGDDLSAGFLVINQTGQAGQATVSFSATGAHVVGDRVQQVELERGAQKLVSFQLEARDPGTVRVQASARLGRESDGVQVELPLHAPALWDTKVVGDGVIQGERSVAVSLPKTALPKLAKLGISVSPGVLASLSGGIDSLLEYPHGCLEQTTSRLIPMVMLEDLLKGSGDARLSGVEHRQRMQAAVAHVLEHRNSDGGFGLWPASESEPFLTAYGLWGLTTARAHGYDVPDRVIETGFAYLDGHGLASNDMHGQFSDAETGPFAAFVLGANQRDKSGFGKQFASKPDQLSRFTTGLLGAALAKSERDATQPLLRTLVAARQRGKNGTLVPESGEGVDFLYYGRDLRATAATVRALVEAGRRDEADDLVAGILAERTEDGSWGTTYNNLWALYALADYVRASAASTTSPVTIKLDGKVERQVQFDRNSSLFSLELPAAKLPAPGDTMTLTLEAPESAKIRFTARLGYVDANQGKSRVEQGFKVDRELVDAETGKAVRDPKVGQLLRVKLHLVADKTTKQVALIDRLPAGFEPVDTSLATERQSAQDDGVGWDWVWRELHDERVTFFADELASGGHDAAYLVRVTRAGSFIRPAAMAEAMYDPSIYGRGLRETVRVTRPPQP